MIETADTHGMSDTEGFWLASALLYVFFAAYLNRNCIRSLLVLAQLTLWTLPALVWLPKSLQACFLGGFTPCS